MAGLIYWIWRRLIWRGQGSKPGTKQSQEWAEKMNRLRLEKAERAAELKALEHEAKKARLELEIAKAEADIEDYTGPEERPEPPEHNPMADFASVALQALFKPKAGGQNVSGIPDRSQDAPGQDRRAAIQDRSGPDKDTAQELIDEIDEQDADD